MSQAKRLDDLSANELLTTQDVASFLGVSVRTVEGWRQQGKPPKYQRFSHKLLRYRAEDVKKFINQQGE
jgi:phage terminase Nu1 subunit (DNA packaging protein)